MRSRRAFTLIEVLVVVAIIALLISILLPSLNRARVEARSVVCRGSMKQVMYAQLLYVHDSQRLPATISLFFESGCPVPSLSTDEQLLRRDLSTWEGGWGASKANMSKLIPAKGTIFRYLKDDALYLCPDDKPGMATDTPQGGGGNGFLSYSMNAYLGWKKPEFRSFTYVADETVLDPNGKTRTFRAGQTVVFNASTTLVLAEEHPFYHLNNRTSANGYGSGFGEGNFNVSDKIVTRHSPALGGSNSGGGVKGRCNIAYLDGHAETRLYPWGTTADQLFAEIGEPSKVAANRRAFTARCTSGGCPK